MTMDKARVDFRGTSLLTLVARAYRVKPFQVSGPEWMSGARFDIAAKLPEGASPANLPEMLRALLAERFGLTAHQDSREFAAYALVIAKGGPKLTPRPADYDAAVRGRTAPMTLDAYADALSRAVDRPVVDMTELKGEFMLSTAGLVRAAAAQMAARRRADAEAASGSPPAEAPEPASPAAALVRDLGLDLVARKLTLPRLVVDRVEKTPTEN
jgi:uncharacterized protein (TIGR03435 family)